MLRFVALACVLAVTVSSLSWQTDRGVKFNEVSGAQLKSAFDNWRITFKKTYANDALESKAFLTFIDNWQYIVNFNENPSDTIVLGMNQFSDLNPTQFRLHVHGHTGSCLRQRVGGAFKRRHYTNNVTPLKANPASVDWSSKGVVTPVKNQGQCGSCWAFSTTGSIECRTAIKTGTLTSLSEQQLVDCSKAEGNDGCQGGLMDNGFKYVEKNGGLCSESEYPYKAKNGVCKASSCGTKYDPISSYTDVTHKSEVSLETAVAAGCVSIAIEADQQAFQFYKSGILSGKCGTRLDHGVLVVGYGAEGSTKYWKVKNSWGGSWGESGYLRMCRDCNKNRGGGECGILEEPSYPVV